MEAMQTHGAFSWMELQVEDVTKVKTFYQDVIGWQMMDMPMQDGSTYAGIALGDQPIGGFASKLVEGPVWLPYITVDEVDRRAQAVAEAGGEVITEPFDAPGVGRIAVIRDPVGAAAALITYAAPPSA